MTFLSSLKRLVKVLKGVKPPKNQTEKLFQLKTKYRMTDKGLSLGNVLKDMANRAKNYLSPKTKLFRFRLQKVSIIGLSFVVFVSSLFGAASLSMSDYQSALADAITTYSCPNGGTLQGTICVVPNSKVPTTSGYSCPNGGTLQGTNCVATTSTPIDLSAQGCFLGGRQISTTFGRGGEPSFTSNVCILPSQFSKTFGGRQGLVGLSDVSPAYQNLDTDNNQFNGVQPIGCASPNLGYNAHLTGPYSFSTDIRNSTDDSHYMRVTNIGGTLMCGFYSNLAFSTTAGRDDFLNNSPNYFSTPDCEFTNVTSCTSGTFYNVFYYWPGGVYGGQQYAASAQSSLQCPQGYTDAGGNDCSYTALATIVQPDPITINNIVDVSNNWTPTISGEMANCTSNSGIYKLSLQAPANDLVNCYFPLTGSAVNRYTIPSGTTINASLPGATGVSEACYINNFAQPTAFWKLDNALELDRAQFIQNISYTNANSTANQINNQSTNFIPQKSGGWVLEGNGQIIPGGQEEFFWRNYTPDPANPGQITGEIGYWTLDGLRLIGGAISASSYIVKDPNWQIVDLGDLNGDSVDDLVWVNYVSAELGVWFMNSSGNITSTQWIDADNNPANGRTFDTNWRVQAVADMNNDGRDDLIWKHNVLPNNEGIAYWYMNGATVTQGVVAGFGQWFNDMNWTIMAAGDLDGDNNNDLLWRHQSTGELAYWLMNNTTFISSDVITISPDGVNTADLNWYPEGIMDIDQDGENDILWKYYNSYSPVLGCDNIPSDNATAGANQPVNITFNNANPTQRGVVEVLNSCPQGQVLLNGNCETPTVITPTNIGNSNNCTSALTVNIPETYICNFPLTGATNNLYALPANPTNAWTATTDTGTTPLANSSSDNCVIVNNGTSNALLRCTNIKTQGGTEGLKNVLLTVNGDTNNPVDRGDVTLAAQTSCPQGQSLVNGVCREQTPVTPTNIGNSTNCTTSLTVQIPNTYNCTFPLTGSQFNNYVLETVPVNAHTATDSAGTTPLANSASDDCTIINNGTPTAALQCNNIKTQGAAPSVRNVLITVGATSPVDRGDVTLTTAPTIITELNTGNGSCVPFEVEVGTLVGECVFPLTGDPFNNYALPNGGITSSITTATGVSEPCTIEGNGTANARLVCRNVPTASGVLGDQTASTNLPGEQSTAPVRLLENITYSEEQSSDASSSNPSSLSSSTNSIMSSISSIASSLISSVTSSDNSNSDSSANSSNNSNGNNSSDSNNSSVVSSITSSINSMVSSVASSVNSSSTMNSSTTNSSGNNSSVVNSSAINSSNGNSSTVSSTPSGSGTVVTAGNTGDGTCNPTSINVGLTTNCLFPLTGDTNNTYQLPSGGITASITTATGNSAPCVIVNNGTSQAGLFCPAVPSTGGTVGNQQAQPNLSGETNSAPIALTNPATTPTTITPNNILNSTDCISSRTVLIPNTYSCTFPLSGNAGDLYALPSSPTRAWTATDATGTTPLAGSSSEPCTIINNGTSNAALRCVNIKTAGGTVGLKNVLMTVNGDGTTPIDRGDVTLATTTQDNRTPLTENDLRNIPISCSRPASVASLFQGLSVYAQTVTQTVNVNSTATCTFTLPEDRRLPDEGLYLGIGNGQVSGLCEVSSTNPRQVICRNVPTGSLVGVQPVNARIGNRPVFDTTSRVNVVATSTVRTGGIALLSLSAMLSGSAMIAAMFSSKKGQARIEI